MTEAIDYNSINLAAPKGQTDTDFNFVSVNPAAPEQDGIEILVSMAKTGKINPWSIDIVDIEKVKFYWHLVHKHNPGNCQIIMIVFNLIDYLAGNRVINFIPRAIEIRIHA